MPALRCGLSHLDDASRSPGCLTASAPAPINATASAGQDLFVLPAAGTGFDIISGFTERNGDVLDLRAALAATTWNHSAATLGTYLKVTDSAGNTNLAIAPKAGSSATAIASLTGTKLDFGQFDGCWAAERVAR